MSADTPLTGIANIRVIELAGGACGPYAGKLFADAGADVIKVEMPGIGDAYRMLSHLPAFPDAEANYMWQMDARNKRSLSLNLKSDEGMALLHRLIAECDVYITNHPLPMRRALNLNYEDLKPLNERMIYASLTAYGEDGPDRDREGFDLVAYPLTLISTAAFAMRRALMDLQAGTPPEPMLSFQELKALVGFEPDSENTDLT